MAPSDMVSPPADELTCSHDMFTDYPRVKEMILNLPSLIEATGLYWADGSYQLFMMINGLSSFVWYSLWKRIPYRKIGTIDFLWFHWFLFVPIAIATEAAKTAEFQDSNQYAAEKAFEDMKNLLDEYQVCFDANVSN